MKKLLSTVALAFCLVISPIVITGCHTPTQQKVAVNTLFSIHTTADAALNGYLDLVLKGTLSTNGVPKVLASYEQFQTAFRSAVGLVSSTTNAVAPSFVSDALTSFTSAVSAAKQGGQ